MPTVLILLIMPVVLIALFMLFVLVALLTIVVHGSDLPCGEAFYCP
ncbi:hypothetical protein [Streptomyces sp. NPDC088725]